MSIDYHVRSVTALDGFAYEFLFAINNWGLLGNVGSTLDVTFSTSRNGYPAIDLVMVNGSNTIAFTFALLIKERDAELTPDDLANECPTGNDWSFIDDNPTQTALNIGQMTTDILPKLCDALSGAFGGAAVSFVSFEREWVGDGHVYGWTVSHELRRILTFAFIARDPVDVDYVHPDFGSHDWPQDGYQSAFWRGSAGSDQHFDTSSSSPDPGDDGSPDIVPAIKRVARAIEGINVRAHMSGHDYSVDITGVSVGPSSGGE